jgi:beta-glucanase (GH16 family)
MFFTTRRIGRARLFCAIVGSTAAAFLYCGSDARAQLVSPGSGKQWSTTWNDEFNAGAPDLTGFTYDVGAGGWGNSELENYTAPPGSPAPQPNPSGLGSFTQPATGTNSNNVFASTDGTGLGALTIRAIATGSGGSQTYTSGRIKTPNLFNQAYGLIEFRAKLPAGTGLWPAVWMLPANASGQTSPKYGGWPTSGEIDILESKGQQTSLVQGSLHSGSSVNTHITQTQTFAGSGLEPVGFSTTDWHTYDMQWTQGSTNVAGSIKWYVDGVLYETQSGGWFVPTTAPAGDKDAPFDQPFYMLLNMAVGGSYVGSPSLAAGNYDMQVDYLRAFSSITSSASPSWKNNASGNWSVPGNWVSAVVPNASGAAAVFGNILTQPRTVTVDAPVTVGSMSFDSSSGYTVGGTQAITLNSPNGGLSPSVTVVSGSHTISAPIIFGKGTTFNITPANGSLNVTSSLSGNVTLTKSGAGMLAVKNLLTTGVTINAGTLQVSANGTNAATSKVQSLIISGSGVLDLTNNDFILDYTGATPLTNIRQMLQTGASSGVGIISSLANASMRLGYADTATFGAGTYGGQQADSTSILIEYTVTGDANLDGHVDVADLGALATNYGAAATWTGGDFTYDGIVDVADLGLLASNYQTGGGGAAAAQSFTSAGTGAAGTVPEPALTGILAIAALCATRRRRHRK